MLAGFDSSGNPISHDPGKSNGYKYMHNKTELSKSWFNKGGIAYTFYPEDTTIINSIEEITAIQPENYYLSQNYPNPFNPSTKIKYKITASPKSSPKERTFVRLIVYDILGNEIATLVNEEKSAGTYEVEFSGKGLSSGIYFYKLEVGASTSSTTFVDVKKMILLK